MNHAALLMQQTKDEYNSMNLTTVSGGTEVLRTLNASPIMLAMQTKSMIKLINLISSSESDRAFSEKDNGVYWFHEQGYENGKVYDAMFDMVGLNGSNLNAVYKLKSYNDFKKMQ
jgi:hypothetical protein